MILMADTNDTAAAVSESVQETVEETVESISALQKFIQDQTPVLVSFALKVVIALAVFIIFHRIITWIRKLVRMSMSKANSDTGVIQFVDSFLKFALHVLLILVIAGMFGVDTTSVAALVASAGVAIGLAVQGSLSNLAGGVLILLLKPFAVGDYIIEDAHKNEGTVKEIQIFYTKLATVDNKTIIIPNGTLANTSLTNVTAKDYRQLDLRIDISYDADLKKAKQLLNDILLSDSCVEKEMDHNVFVDKLGESSVVLGMRAWVKTGDYWPTRWRMLETIKLTMDENNIEIPFNQLTIHWDSENQAADK